MKSKIGAIILCVIFFLTVVGLTLLFLPYIERLSDSEYQQQFETWVSDRGVIGILAVFGLQVLQVIIAFIPGGPVEVIAGVLYGTVGGTLLCLGGCIAATIVIFTISRHFGRKLLCFFFQEESIDRWNWLHDSRKMGIVIFLLFFIPGMPKDMLTYIVGISDVRLEKFILISTVARTPSIVSTALVGSSMRQGQWTISLLVFAVTGIVGVTGILLKDRVIAVCRGFSKKRSEWMEEKRSKKK